MRYVPFLMPLLLMLLVGCRQQELVTALDQTQANEIIALLQRNNIEASKQEVAKSGYRIAVEKSDFPAAVDLMNTWGLPSKPRMEIAQMFPADALVSSPVAEKARLNSAIEQRLEQSLLTMTGIVSARVHVSYDLNEIENSSKPTPPHLSALVKYLPGRQDETVMIGEIKRFLKNSFNDVNYDDISVVLSPIADIQRLSAQPVQRSTSGPVIIGLLIILLIGFTGLGFFFLKNRSRGKGDESEPA